MKKRFLTFLMVLVLLLSLPFHTQAAEEEFSGTRTAAFTADWSDLENFVNGGRSAFSLILRSELPEWATYKLRTQGRDVTLTLSFSFDSLPDYKEKVAYLTLRTPSLICSQEDGLLLIENGTSIDLLSFLKAELDARNSLSEKTLDQIFALSDSRITINSEAYELTDGVCIHPDGMEFTPMDKLSVETQTAKNNAYTRTITATIDLNKGSSGDVEDLENQFNQVGEARVKRESGNERTVSVTFEALSQAELERKTMLCLNAPTFISEQQAYLDNRTVSVERTEFFDLEQLLREEGTFYYSFSLPSYCENLSASDAQVQLSETCITAENTSFITCAYERPLQFSAVEIHTDMSSLFGKMERTILCTVPTTIADHYHNTIKEKLQLNLCNGSVLNIYDEAGMRHYEITFSAWRATDIEEFTIAVLNSSDYAFESQTSWIPFGKSEIADSYDADDLISRIVPAERMTASYTLSNLSVFAKDMADAENAEISGKTITFQIRSGSGISIVYRQIHIIRCVLLLAAFVILLILVRRIIRTIRRFTARLRGKKIPSEHPSRKKKQPAQPSVFFCPYCGERNTTANRFCHHCGRGLEEFQDLP